MCVTRDPWPHQFKWFVLHFGLIPFLDNEDAAVARCFGLIQSGFHRGRSPSAGLQVSAEPLCRGGPWPHLTVQHLQRWLQVRIWVWFLKWAFFVCVCVLETNEEANLKKLTPKYYFNMMYVGLLFCKNYKKNIINNQRFFFVSQCCPWGGAFRWFLSPWGLRNCFRNVEREMGQDCTVS